MACVLKTRTEKTAKTANARERFYKHTLLENGSAAVTKLYNKHAYNYGRAARSGIFYAVCSSDCLTLYM
jgi:hypothetical protein